MVDSPSKTLGDLTLFGDANGIFSSPNAPKSQISTSRKGHHAQRLDYEENEIFPLFGVRRRDVVIEAILDADGQGSNANNDQRDSQGILHWGIILKRF